MRIAPVPHAGAAALEPPLWPPLLATRGPGSRSEAHAHHAMHLILCVSGELAVRVGTSGWQRGAGVLTAPDARHAIDATGAEILLVFLDPESAVGASLQGVVSGAVRLASDAERDLLIGEADPMAIMRAGGVEWTRQAVAVLGGTPVASERRVHPRVRRLLALLREQAPGAERSLESLAEAVGLSAGRLMHAFTESVGVPLRPYLAWLKLQRAAAAIAGGAPLTAAAQAAGFADAAHMSRTFRQMLGVSPKALRPAPRS
jgi:AraC-like DNA-binding protein